MGILMGKYTNYKIKNYKHLVDDGERVFITDANEDVEVLNLRHFVERASGDWMRDDPEKDKHLLAGGLEEAEHWCAHNRARVASWFSEADRTKVSSWLTVLRLRYL